MQLKSDEGMTLQEAKATFDNGNVKYIRVDIVLGEYYLMVCTKISEKPIRTQRNTYKSYKSLTAIMKDYRYITSSEAKSLILK